MAAASVAAATPVLLALKSCTAAHCGRRPCAPARHAHPHKADLEVYDRSLLEFATDMTHQLDATFGQPRKKTLLLVRSACSRGVTRLHHVRHKTRF